MTKDQDRIKEYEKNYIKQINTILEKIRFEINKKESIIQSNLKGFNMGRVRFPNACIVTGNKINELINIFNKKGISMLSRYDEDIDLIYVPMLGEALMEDLIYKLLIASEKLKKYEKTLDTFADEALDVVSNPLLRIIGFINYMYTDENKLLSLTDEEINLLNSYRKDYSDAVNEIFSYSLEKNINEVIVRKALYSNGLTSQSPVYIITYILELVIPDLVKLGFEENIPDIINNIVDNYENKKQLINHLKESYPQLHSMIRKHTNNF